MQQYISNEDTEVLDEIKDQMTELNDYPDALEDPKMLAGQPLAKNRGSLLLLRAAVAAGSLSQRS